MYDKDKAKQTIFWLIIALATLFLTLPVLAEARKDIDEPQIFINYEELKKPKNEPTPSLTPVVAAKSKPAAKVQPRKDTKPPTPKASGRDYGTGEIQDLIRKYSQQYGIDPATPLCIAKKESGFNPNSKNKSSSASGVFQYLSSTWRSTDEGKAGLSVFDAESNIRAAVKYMSSRGNAKPWTVAKSCPSVTQLK